MFYRYLVEKNPNVKYEYERYVQENLQEHYTNRLKHWRILFSLNWHYRVRKKTQPLLFWDQGSYLTTKQDEECKKEYAPEVRDIVGDVYNGSLKPACEIYEKIMNDFPTATKLLVCPYSGTGDVYLVGLYLQNYIKKQNIKDYVLAVIGRANYKVANLFAINNVVQISQDEADKLTYLYMVVGDEFQGIGIMHHDPMQNYCGILENIRNVKETRFVDMYIYNVFCCNVQDGKQLPEFNYESKRIADLFFKHRLEPNNTVVLSPYVNTLPAIPPWVWVELAKRLKLEGYVVGTNCGGPSEKAVEGTIELRFDYDISVPVLEKCGYFIGIRSGFCDIVSSAKCKKIIIYQPYIFWGDGSNLDYFSLNKNELCDDAIEIEYVGIQFYKMIDQIIKCVKE